MKIQAVERTVELTILQEMVHAAMWTVFSFYLAGVFTKARFFDELDGRPLLVWLYKILSSFSSGGGSYDLLREGLSITSLNIDKLFGRIDSDASHCAEVDQNTALSATRAGR